MRRLLLLLALATAGIPAWQVRSADAAAMNRCCDATISAALSQSSPAMADRRSTSLSELLGRIDGSIDFPHLKTPPAEWFAAALNLGQGGRRSADSLQARHVRWQI